MAGIDTTTRKSEDRTRYIVNGTNKSMTNGVFWDYCVTGVKMDKGFSMLLV